MAKEAKREKGLRVERIGNRRNIVKKFVLAANGEE